jgi:hypothetical protein
VSKYENVLFAIALYFIFWPNLLLSITHLGKHNTQIKEFREEASSSYNEFIP